jgi:phosphonate transport system permease protein
VDGGGNRKPYPDELMGGWLYASNITPARVHQPMRRLMDACRAINEMVFAILFVVAVGLGPFAGALVVHSTDAHAKLFCRIGGGDRPSAVEGIRATCAHKLVEVAHGVIPQVLPLWIGFTLYRSDSNVRSASVVGMVGSGGTGDREVQNDSQLPVRADLLILVLTVSLIDLPQERLRGRFI